MNNFSGWIRKELMKTQAKHMKATPDKTEKYAAYCHPCDITFFNTDPDMLRGRMPCSNCGKATLYLGLFE